MTTTGKIRRSLIGTLQAVGGSHSTVNSLSTGWNLGERTARVSVPSSMRTRGIERSHVVREGASTSTATN